jgi:MoxR-like ATPase
MNQASARIGDKTIQLQQPFGGDLGRCIGRNKEIKKVLAAWMDGSAALPMSPLLIVPAGQGKNRVVYECARISQKPLYIIQGNEDITAESLICIGRISDDVNKKVDYIASSLLSAMILGGICFIDEIAKMRPMALAPLASVLDERRTIKSELLGEEIQAHPAFRFIAATNHSDLDFQPLSEFLDSRLSLKIPVNCPDSKDIDAILKARFKPLNGNTSNILNCFWNLWRLNMKDQPVNPRDIVQLFGFAMNLADLEALGGNPTRACVGHRFGTLQDRHLEDAFDSLFGVKKGFSA